MEMETQMWAKGTKYCCIQTTFAMMTNVLITIKTDTLCRSKNTVTSTTSILLHPQMHRDILHKKQKCKHCS